MTEAAIPKIWTRTEWDHFMKRQIRMELKSRRERGHEISQQELEALPDIIAANVNFAAVPAGQA